MSAQVTEAKQTVWQGLMDSFYEGWQNSEKRGDRIDKYDERTQAAVRLGNLNYQVQNGGFAQWVGNGYASEDIDEVMKLLRQIGTPAAAKVLDILSQFESKIERTENTGCFGNYWVSEECGDCGGNGSTDCHHCDGTGKVECDDGEEGEGEVDCSYCDGNGDIGCDTCGGNGTCNDQDVHHLDDDFYAVNDQFQADVEAFLSHDKLPEAPAIQPPKPSNDGTRYPSVHVKLVGEDGNPLSVVARCKTAARRAKVPHNEIDTFVKEALSGDYNHVLTTCLRWFDCN